MLGPGPDYGWLDPYHTRQDFSARLPAVMSGTSNITLILERAAGAEVGGSSIETSKIVGMDLAVSPRWLRHAHASHALDRRAPIQLVQATFATPRSEERRVVISTLARRLVFLPIRAHP